MSKRFTLSLIFSLATALIPSFQTNSSSIYRNVYEEKDCALAGTDFIDPETRKTLVLSNNPYSSNITAYSDFKTSYFDNLTYNFGMNYKGSCGYVALAMLLSYYDTYQSDSIIPEQYDINSVGNGSDTTARRNSPGVMKDAILSPDTGDFSYGYTVDASAYYSSISALSNSSLHAKLITIAASKGYYDFDDDYNPCATTYTMRYDVLNDYFADVVGYQLNTDYSIVSCNEERNPSASNSVRDFAIQQVQQGNPVLLSVGGNGGHVVVAYDYDANTDELFCHMGWNASSTHRTVESFGFSIYKTALALNFNASHTHSNNYAVVTVTDGIPSTGYYCYHDCHIVTYTNGNRHEYTDHFVYYSSSKHKAYCYCGKYVLLAHGVAAGTTWIRNGHTYGTCIDCRAVIDLGKGFVITGAKSTSTEDNNGLYLDQGVYWTIGNGFEAFQNEENREVEVSL